MISDEVKNYLPELDLKQKQANNIVLINFWSQFSVYSLNTILVLFLTRPLISQGLGYSEAQAYAFIGVAHATGYLIPILGGYMADTVIGIRRSILLGSILLAIAYLFIMLSGFTVGFHGDLLFLAAYSFIPASNSLLMGTSSSMVSHIYAKDAIKAKSAMTYYYMAINVGALLASLISPVLLDSRYGPLSILTIAFIGKSIAALNFAKNFSLYDNVIWGKDLQQFSASGISRLIIYISLIYMATYYAFTHVFIASTFIALGCGGGIFWFFRKTLALEGVTRIRQMVALLLILEAIVFFVIFNQMNSTLVLFAQNNSNHDLFGLTVSPAHYQMLNPLLILAIGSQLPRFYKWVPRFTIPYQFAAGVFLSGVALLVLLLAANQAQDGLVNGNYIAVTYILISISELWVSAIGLSMIGLYCDQKSIAFAMGVWYLASSLAHAISGKLASLVAIPDHIVDPAISLVYYRNYYFMLGSCALVSGFIMYFVARRLQRFMHTRGIDLH